MLKLIVIGVILKCALVLSQYSVYYTVPGYEVGITNGYRTSKSYWGNGNVVPQTKEAQTVNYYPQTGMYYPQTGNAYYPQTGTGYYPQNGGYPQRDFTKSMVETNFIRPQTNQYGNQYPNQIETLDRDYNQMNYNGYNNQMGYNRGGYPTTYGTQDSYNNNWNDRKYMTPFTTNRRPTSVIGLE